MWVFSGFLVAIFTVNILAAVSMLGLGYVAQLLGEDACNAPVTWMIVCGLGAGVGVTAAIVMAKHKW